MLVPGSRLGPYEVVALLGAGGMGQVFRARDPRLGRDVALKVLPEAFEADDDRRSRFEREARALAALSHPHIAQVYGIEERAAAPDVPAVRALVMELVPGESLDARLKRAPPSMREALDLARQIAEGLEAAHDKGIVHRDLKPANVQVTPDGVAKILDFGLARAPAASSDDAETTLTGPLQVTAPGTVVGTAAYMSPEQSRGIAVDARTDVWAFGAVLFEMLAGQRAFAGQTASDLLVQVLDRDPDWTRLPQSTPPAVRTLIQRCLRKEPRQRLHDIADARFVLEDVLATQTATPSDAVAAVTGSGPAGGPARSAAVRRALPIVHALTTLGLAAALVATLARQSPSPETPRHVSVVLPPSQELADRYPAISPDGRTVVYGAVAEEGPPGPEGNVRRLYRRNLSDTDSQPLPGTEGAAGPFFSPDGAWVAFTSIEDGTVKKIALSGGGPVTVADLRGLAPSDIGPGTWTSTGDLLLPDESGPVRRVPVSGGTTSAALPRNAILQGESGMRFPLQMSGDTLLFVPLRPGGGLASWVAGVRHELSKVGFQPQITGADQVLFLRRVNERQIDLSATTINAAGTALQGEPVTLLSLEARGGSSYSLAGDGTLLYVAAQVGYAQTAREWVTLDERPSSTPTARSTRSPGPRPALPTGYPIRLSPDGRYGAGREGEGITVRDLVSGARRILVPQGGGGQPIWNHDGTRIIFQVGPDAPGGAGLLWQPADGSAAAERLTSSKGWQQPQMVTRDGRFLVFTASGGLGTRDPSMEVDFDLWLLPLNPRGQERPLLRTTANERLGFVSPDSKWLAYVSDESGRSEVWVRSFPDGPVGSQVSQGGGTEPVWAPDGLTLYYRSLGGSRLYSVPVVPGPGLQFGVPEQRVGHWRTGSGFSREPEITPDGTAMILPPAPTHGRELRLVLNFDEVIRQKLQ